MSELMIGVLAGVLTMFINYCIGSPGSKEFSPHEIFSFYTVWLSKRRLKQSRPTVLAQHESMYSKAAKNTSAEELTPLRKDFNKIIYEAADPLFTWERAVGMCSICSGFWTSLIVGIYFTKDFIQLITIVLISHLTIRLLNKVIL